MRKLAFVLLLAACGKSPTTGGPDGSNGGPDGNGSNAGPAAFEIKSPDILLPHGTEFTKCFYFHTSNTSTVAINKWISDMTPGSHHLIMFLNTSGASQPADGTIDSNCSFGNSATNIPAWTYAAAVPHAEEDMPADDGTGKPLAQNIAANTPGFVQMHYLNSSDTDEMVHIDIKAYALDAATAYTPTAPYITYTKNFSVPPGNSTITGSCAAPAGAKFWQLSSHTHKQGSEVKITDAASMVYDTTSWEHPDVKQFPTAPFYTFTSNMVSWACSYINPTNSAISEGQSAQTNEMCMATGYYFPATAAKLMVQLYNGTSPGQCIGI